MTDIILPMLEIAVIIPGMLLAYLPTQTYIKYPTLKLFAWVTPLQIILCIFGGFLCYTLNISTEIPMLIAAVILICVYIHSLDVSFWKSVSIALAICAVFTCVNSLSRAVNAILTTENSLWFCTRAALIYNLICWVFVLFAWYPATHAAKSLVEDENMAQTWYVFSFLPLVFIGLNLFMIPRHEGTLYHGRIMQGYIVISLVLLAILALFYALFLITANNLNKNARLQQENEFLAMQQVRYDSLRTTIEETRHARHDMRHHFLQLSSLANNEEWDKLKQYLENVSGKLPNQNLKFAENRAADSVLSYYCELAAREEVPYITQIDLPETLPIDEMDMCLVLSNLLENALEASMKTKKERCYIKVESRLHSDHLFLLLVENAFDAEIKEKDGVFRSSKRKGNGIGIQSVRRISEKNGGNSDFTYENGVFTAKVILHAK